MTKPIRTILIANRGEIALRVIATCRQLGIKTVTLYTEGEEALPHAHAGDVSVCLGSGALAETYLNQEKIIEIARKTKADAIHPGYGFLSENARFCEKATKAGLIFIGPTAKVITLMGDKVESRKAMEKIGVPVVPGYHAARQDIATLKAKAKEIGYPVLIKASAGGGGKGMRVVGSEKELAEAVESARREARNAFGDDRVFMEKYIVNPRHIEVQVFSDSHGNHLHLFERECSIQRRHQKIVEESPSPALDAALRKKITETAVRITSGIGYLGAGTVEFIMGQDGGFYFLEMNTRLQVEHPVTEMVLGLDLVKMQIQAAQGEKLKLKQSDIVQRGHAIEVRICAEDPDNNFMPTIGAVHAVGRAVLPGVRLDSGYADGTVVTTSFDPMLAKLIAWAETREAAISKLIAALEDVRFAGIKTNRSYLARILAHKAFAKGETYTNFVETHKEALAAKPLADAEIAQLAAAFLLAAPVAGAQAGNDNRAAVTPWNNPKLAGFRNA